VISVRLASISLRGSAGRYVLGVTAIALAVAFMVAGAMIAEAFRGSVTTMALDAPREVTNVIRASERLPPEAVSDVAGVPVVGSEAAIVDSLGEVLGSTATLVVADPRVVRVAEGRLPETVEEVALDPFLASLAGAGVGEQVSLVGSDGGMVQRTVVGLVRPSYGRGEVVALTARGVQSLVGGTGWSHLLLFGDGPADQQAYDVVASRLPESVSAQLLPTGDADRGTGDLGTLTTLLGALLFVVLVAAVFVISNSFAAVAESRRRQTALLRIIGTDRAQVRRSVLLEGAVVGAVGVVMGLMLGAVTGRVASSALMFPVWPSRGSLITAGILGLAVTLVAVWQPARQAAATSPLAALGGAQMAAVEPVPKSRATVGVVLLVVVVLVIQIPLVGSLVGGTLAFLALVALGPWLTPRMARWLMPGRSPVARLARQNVTRSARRTARTATALMLGVALAATGTAIASALTNINQFDARYRVAVVAPTVTPELSAQLAAIPEVDEVFGEGGSFAELGLSLEADTDAIRARTEQIIAGFPGARLAEPEDFSAREPFSRALGLGLAVMSVMALAVGVVGVANAVVLGVWERGRELAVLRAVGVTRGQVLAMVLREAAGLTAIGLAFGLLLGIVTVYGMLGPLSVILIPLISWWLVMLVCLATLVAGIAAAWWPARRASRTEPAGALAAAG
jgi:putative ABC transport system permease protein